MTLSKTYKHYTLKHTYVHTRTRTYVQIERSDTKMHK